MWVFFIMFSVPVRETVRDSFPSSSGLGHCPFTAATGVQIPLGTPRSGVGGLHHCTALDSGAFFMPYLPDAH